MRSALAGILVFLSGVAVGALLALWYSESNSNDRSRSLATAGALTPPPPLNWSGEPPDLTADPVVSRPVSLAGESTEVVEAGKSPTPSLTEEPPEAPNLVPKENEEVELPSVKEIRSQILSLMRVEERRRQPYEGYLRQLSERGDQDSIGAILSFMENPRCDFPHRASFFAEILLEVSDPRIYPAARRVLEKNLENGLDSWPHTMGYVALVAEQGGDEGGDVLLSLIYRNDAISFVAAGEVWRLNEPLLANPLLEEIKDGDKVTTFPIADGLVRWNNDSVSERLHRIALQADTHPRTKDAIYKALLAHSSSERVKMYAAEYWNTKNESDRKAILGALGYLAASANVDPIEARETATPLLKDALVDRSREVWGKAVTTIDNNDVYYTSEILSALEDLLSRLQSPDEQSVVRATLTKVRQELR